MSNCNKGALRRSSVQRPDRQRGGASGPTPGGGGAPSSSRRGPGSKRGPRRPSGRGSPVGPGRPAMAKRSGGEGGGGGGGTAPGPRSPRTSAPRGSIGPFGGGGGPSRSGPAPGGGGGGGAICAAAGRVTAIRPQSVRVARAGLRKRGFMRVMDGSPNDLRQDRRWTEDRRGGCSARGDRVSKCTAAQRVVTKPRAGPDDTIGDKSGLA